MPKPGVEIVCCAKTTVLDAATVWPSSPLPTTCTSRAWNGLSAAALSPTTPLVWPAGTVLGMDRHAAVRRDAEDIEGDRPVVSAARDRHRNQRRAAAGDGDLLVVEGELERRSRPA